MSFRPAACREEQRLVQTRVQTPPLSGYVHGSPAEPGGGQDAPTHTYQLDDRAVWSLENDSCRMTLWNSWNGPALFSCGRNMLFWFHALC